MPATTSPKHDFIPSREGILLQWSRVFSDHINAAPGSFGLTPAQAAGYAALHSNFATKYTLAINASTNSKTNIVAKNMAKNALKASARMLAHLVRATPGVTNEQRGQLGLTIPDPDLTPVAQPSNPPVLTILPSIGRIVRIRLRDKAAPDRLGKPPGIAGAAVLSYVGGPDENDPPARMADWAFHGNATRQFFNVRFDGQVPPGSKVWIAASWYNTRGEFGPASAPQLTRIGEGLSTLRMAA